MFLNKFLVTVISSELQAFEHHKLINRQTLCWVPGERSLPIGLLVSVLCLLCLCACLFICALWLPAGKGLTSWLSFVVSNCEFSYWYLGSGVVLDCIDS